MNASFREVSTSGRLPCDARRAWEKVCFYEHIGSKPSPLLRLLLPTPLESTGSYSQAGDVSRCLYSDGGFLAKKVTRVVPGQRVDFDVVEQSIRYCRRIALLGGWIEITAHDDGSSSVRMLTRYALRFPTFFVARFFVEWVISTMHKVVIRDMQEGLSSTPA